MSSSCAVSATVRVSTPSCDEEVVALVRARARSRPRVGFSPTRPVHAAGMRIEPPPSLPCASGTMPPATAAAAPPLEPPGVRSVSQGLRAGPNRRGSDTGRIPNSGMFVLPTITKPASRMRRVTNESWSGHEVAEQVRAHRVRHPRDRGGVLDRDRHAGEGPRVVPVDPRPLPQCAIRVDVDERIEGGLELLDPLERGGHQLGRADLPGMHERGQLGGGPEEKVLRHRSAQPTGASCDAGATAAVKECNMPPPPGPKSSGLVALSGHMARTKVDPRRCWRLRGGSGVL